MDDSDKTAKIIMIPRCVPKQSVKHMKTTIVGVFQILGAIAFAVFKLSNGLSFTDAEAGMVMLALTSGYKGIVSADAKPNV